MDPILAKVLTAVVLVPLLVPIIVDRVREIRALRSADRTLEEIRRLSGGPHG